MQPKHEHPARTGNSKNREPTRAVSLRRVPKGGPDTLEDGAGGVSSLRSKKAFIRALQRLIPEVREEDLVPAPAGIRAQEVRPDGALVDDFEMRSEGRMVHLINAPSPAATASLSIGSAVDGLGK